MMEFNDGNIFNDVISKDIDFFLTSNKIDFVKKILPGEFVMYEFTSCCDMDIIYHLYIYDTFVIFEYEDRNFFTYPGPYSIDIIDGFWKDMSSQNKNVIFNLVLNNYNNPIEYIQRRCNTQIKNNKRNNRR